MINAIIFERKGGMSIPRRKAKMFKLVLKVSCVSMAVILKAEKETTHRKRIQILCNYCFDKQHKNSLIA